MTYETSNVFLDHNVGVMPTILNSYHLILILESHLVTNSQKMLCANLNLMLLVEGEILLRLRYIPSIHVLKVIQYHANHLVLQDNKPCRET